MEHPVSSRVGKGLEQVPSASELSLSDDSSRESRISGVGNREQLYGEGKSDDIQPLNKDYFDPNRNSVPLCKQTLPSSFDGKVAAGEDEGTSDDAIPSCNDNNPVPETTLLCKPIYSPISFDSLVGRVIGTTNLMELVACPCCQQCFDDTQPATLNEPTLSCSTRRHVATMSARSRSILNTGSGSHDEDDEIEEEKDEDVLPGVLAAGVHYSPKKIEVEGWLYKKGSGTDWFGSRAWKPRWARLALARVDGYDFDVPLLLIYWYPSSATATTVVVLDSTVVLATDIEDKNKWNSYRFEIRHVPKTGSSNTLVTRTFTAPKKNRDDWVYAISQALFSFEKQKDKSRKLASMQAVKIASRRSRSPEPIANPMYDDVWTGERFVTVEERGQKSPPNSPNLSRGNRQLPPHSASPPIPRPRGRPGALNSSQSPPRDVIT